MSGIWRLLAILTTIGLLGTACASKSGQALSSGGDYEELQWQDLLPPNSSSQDFSSRYEDRLAAVIDGTPEADALYEEMQAEAEVVGGEVNADLDGKEIGLAGFVAPLSYEDDIVTEFLLVPYFGACIHVPAPPPNQTIMVTLDKAEGLTIEETFGAVLVTGTLAATSTDTDLAEAGYTITEAKSDVQDTL